MNKDNEVVYYELFTGRDADGMNHFGINLKKIGKDISTADKQLGKNISVVVKKAEKELAKTGQDVLYAPLLIWKPVLVSELDKKGVKHSNDIADIAHKFADNIITKKNFGPESDEYYSTFIGRGEISQRNKDIQKGIAAINANNMAQALYILQPYEYWMKKKLDQMGIPFNDSLTEVSLKYGDNVIGSHEFDRGYNIIDDIISVILDFINQITQKAKSGKKLDPTEQAVYDHTKGISEQINQGVKQHVETEVGSSITSFLFSPKGAFISVVVLALIIFGAYKLFESK